VVPSDALPVVVEVLLVPDTPALVSHLSETLQQGDVESSPRQTRAIYEVVAVEKIDEDVGRALREGRITKDEAERLTQQPHVLRLRRHLTLNQGLELSLIRAWVGEGRLSKNMNNCGRLGFNICQVESGDYEAIVEWNRTVPPEPLASVGSILEEDLRRHIAAQKSLAPMFGRHTEDTSCLLKAEGFPYGSYGKKANCMDERLDILESDIPEVSLYRHRPR